MRGTITAGADSRVPLGPNKSPRIWTLPAQIVAESMAVWLGARSADVARRYDMHRNQLYTWRREARIGDAALFAAAWSPAGRAAGSALSADEGNRRFRNPANDSPPALHRSSIMIEARPQTAKSMSPGRQKAPRRTGPL